MPEDLRLGSLHVDPANPLEGEHKRFTCPLTDAELYEWTGDAEYDDSCVLNFNTSRDWLADAGVLGLFKGQAGTGRSVQARLEGESGRRLQIKRPESLLNEVVLKSPSAKAWLGQQLSISRKMYRLSQLKFGKSRHPRIWLVTGIQYLSNARVVSEWSKSSEASLGFTVPVPEPITAAATVVTGQGALSAKASLSSHADSSVAYHHHDERVWAAQFTPLKVKFHPASQGVDEATFPTHIKLHELEDLVTTGVRAGAQSGHPGPAEGFAEISGLEEQNSNEQPEETESQLINATQGIDWEFYEECLEVGTAAL